MKLTGTSFDFGKKDFILVEEAPTAPHPYLACNPVLNRIVDAGWHDN
jgi:hypothetical protein